MGRNVSFSLRHFKQVVHGGDPKHVHVWKCGSIKPNGLVDLRCSCGASTENIGNYHAFYREMQQTLMQGVNTHPKVILPF